MSKRVHLIIIDPQNDFCDQPGAALAVPGAVKDMERLAAFITKQGKRLSAIHCTLDSHQTIHIAHPIFWVDSTGAHPGFFTTITDDDVRNGKWRAYRPDLQSWAQNYVSVLKKNGRYPLMIWPPHCRIGTWGHSIYPAVATALTTWEEMFARQVDFVTKGSNPFTEHYSAVQADVPDPKDPSTKLNTALIDVLATADEILLSGEALSHCLANSVNDIAASFGDDNIKKLILLRDTTSNVANCDKLGDDFIKGMTKRGMQIATTDSYV